MTRCRSTLPLVVATLAGGLLLTACGSSDSDSAAASSASASASTSTDGAADTTDGSPDASAAGSSSGSSASGSNAAASSNGSSGTGGSGSSGSTAAPGKAGAGTGSGGAACRTADLSFGYGPDSGAQVVDEAGAVIIKMTNKGSSTCTMNGYPGLDLVGSGINWSLTRQTSVAPHPVTVRPGASTSFTITYLPFTKGGGNQAADIKTIVITPPNETHSARMAWDFQPVLRQDGATHPGTFVGPVGAE